MQGLGTVPRNRVVTSATSRLRGRKACALAVSCAALIALTVSCGDSHLCQGPPDAPEGPGPDSNPPGTLFFVGGRVMGLGAGESVVLQNNRRNDLAVSTNGNFVFPTPISSNSTYAVTVRSHPAGSTCTVTRGSGTVAAHDITDVAVACTGTACALPWGGVINDGQSVTAYQLSSVCGSKSPCVSETRTCSRGVLSGTFTNQACSVGMASCGINCILYSCPGTYSFTVPGGITSIDATVVGGGGGGGGGGTRVGCSCGGPQCTYVNAGGGGGGAGGAVAVRASVTSGASLSLTVGAAGTPGAAGGGGGGGPGGEGGTSALNGPGFSVTATGGNGGPESGSAGGGTAGTISSSGVLVLQGNPSGAGGSGGSAVGLCDFSRSFLVNGGDGGTTTASQVSGAGGGGMGGACDTTNGVAGVSGQPGVVRITW